MGEPIRVLHVDDEADFAETAARFLEREDDAFEVVTETSAAAGLDRIEATEVDCVVSDYQMPGTDGIEFLARVRDRYPDLPFVLFTGQGSEAVAGEAISAGATDYLQKETGTEQYGILANRVRNAVESRRTERAVERTRARLRAIVDLLPHPLYVVDREGTYLLANEALASLHDRTVEEVEGTTIREVLSEEEVEQFLSDVAEVVETGAVAESIAARIEESGALDVDDVRSAVSFDDVATVAKRPDEHRFCAGAIRPSRLSVDWKRPFLSPASATIALRDVRTAADPGSAGVAVTLPVGRRWG